MIDRLIYRTFVALACVVTIGTSSYADAIHTAKRVALVVGNSNYKHVVELPNPTKDAQLIADTLNRLGFTLVGGGPQLNLDKNAFDRAVQDFGNAAQGADVALFYYAGHGLQINGENYLVPISANPTRVADVDFQMLDAALVLKQMEGAGTRLNMMILDACRNNPFGGRGLRAVTGGLAQIQAPQGTLISFATQPGNVALDGKTGHSPYTQALADILPKPGLDVFRTFNQVGLLVSKATGGSQQPWVSASPIRGDFFFAGLPPDPEAEQRRRYEDTLKLNTKEAWDSFLTVYKDGFFVDLARVRRDKIIADEKARSAIKAQADAEKRAEVALKAKADAEARAKMASDARMKAEAAAKQAAEGKAKADALAAANAHRASEAKAEYERQVREATKARQALEEKAAQEEAKRNKYAAERAAALEKDRKSQEAKLAQKAADKAAELEQERKAREASAVEKATALEKERQNASLKAAQALIEKMASDAAAKAAQEAAEIAAKRAAELVAKQASEQTKSSTDTGQPKLASLSPSGQGTSEAVAPKLMPADIAQLLKLRLKQLGCDPGDDTGEWNASAKRALEKFNRYAGTKVDADSPSLAAWDIVRSKHGIVCPLVCGHGTRRDGDECVPIKPKKTATKPSDDTVVFGSVEFLHMKYLCFQVGEKSACSKLCSGGLTGACKRSSTSSSSLKNLGPRYGPDGKKYGRGR